MWEKNDWLDSLLGSDELEELVKMGSEDVLVGLQMNGALDVEGRIPLYSEKNEPLYAKYSDGDTIYIDQEDIEDWIAYRLEFVDEDFKKDIEQNLILY